MINYKHLHYFWAVAKEGSIARASERLNLTPQTISGQLGLLEDHLGEALFTRTVGVELCGRDIFTGGRAGRNGAQSPGWEAATF